jgi:hypothetical protein
LGIAARSAHSSWATVEHFDEGVYASNLWFGPELGSQYPQRHLYAPPLMPWLIEWTLVFCGPSGANPVWPSQVAGMATIGIVWWVGRTVFGPWAGLVAGTLAALSGAHILLSRSALTDALLLFWFVLAMGLFERAGRQKRWRDFTWFGIAVGLAWWTKYNGWLPLFIGLVSLGLQWVACPAIRLHTRRLFAGFFLAALVAFLIWTPYLLSLQSRGGYAAVTANHRQYLVGMAGWWSSLTRQLSNLGYLGGWFNLDWLCLAGGAIGTVVALYTCWHRRLETTAARGSHQEPPAGGAWLMGTWFGVLAAMTPLYTPYPRLLLPWLAAGWILSGALVETLIGRLIQSWQPGASVAARWPRAIGPSMLGLCLGFAGIVVYSSSRVWADRRGLEAVAGQVSQLLARAENPRPELPAAVYVYGEPALVFQLRAAGVALVSPVQTVELRPVSFDGGAVPTYLATGPHASRDPAFQAAWSAVPSRYELLATYSFRPSPLVLLDNYAPSQLGRDSPIEEVRLYRIR